jgi:hypothetical protein
MKRLMRIGRDFRKYLKKSLGLLTILFFLFHLLMKRGIHVDDGRENAGHCIC